MLQSRRGNVVAPYERDRSSFRGDGELDQDKPRWLDSWMATRHWEGRASVDHYRSEPNFKTVEMHPSSHQQLPYTYLQRSPRRAHSLIQQQHYQQCPASPIHHMAHSHSSHLHQQSPATPSPSITRPIQVRSSTPRCLREDVRYNGLSQTPSLQSNYHYNGFLNRHNGGRLEVALVSGMQGWEEHQYPKLHGSLRVSQGPDLVPERTNSRLRSSMPERDRGVGSVKKRLWFPVPPAPEEYAGGLFGGGYSLRSASLKSMSTVRDSSCATSAQATTSQVVDGQLRPSSNNQQQGSAQTIHPAGGAPSRVIFTFRRQFH